MIEKFKKRIFPKISLIFILFFILNCFEYEENIYFKKGFSGYVDISYSVPINQRTGDSIIKFLPINQDDIEKRINKGLFSKSVKIRDFSISIIEKEDLPGISYFQKKAKVNYRVDFIDISTLDGVLLGNLFVKKRGNSIYIKREFRTVLKNADQESSSGEKKIRSETHRLLGDGYVHFKVHFPQSSECKSNQGEIGLGILSYKFPLVETVEKAGNKIWDYSITTIY
jgi:hypothetical protein